MIAVDPMRILIALACLCVIGWSVYIAGDRLLDYVEYLEHQRYAAAKNAAWDHCVFPTADDKHAADFRNYSYDTRVQLCRQMGLQP